MESFIKDRIKEFGNPAAYHENRLYHIFCEHGREDLYYLLIFYGLGQEEDIDVPLERRYRQLLRKIMKYQQKRIENISKFIDSGKPPGLWLDMGCGVGQFMNQIVELNGNYAIGTDISFDTVKKASSLLNKLIDNRSYCFVNQDSLELPFVDNAFDYILSADVLEHVGYDTQRKVVSEMYRVLRKGGQAIVHTPNLNRVRVTTFLRRIYYLFKAVNPFIIRHSFPKDHVSLTTAKRLRRICQSVGFKVRTYYQVGWRPYELHRWILLGLDSVFSRSFILVLSKKE